MMMKDKHGYVEVSILFIKLLEYQIELTFPTLMPAQGFVILILSWPSF